MSPLSSTGMSLVPSVLSFACNHFRVDIRDPQHPNIVHIMCFSLRLPITFVGSKSKYRPDSLQWRFEEQSLFERIKMTLLDLFDISMLVLRRAFKDWKPTWGHMYFMSSMIKEPEIVMRKLL